MIQRKITTIIAAMAIVSIALVIDLSQTQTTTAADAPAGNNIYLFAEGVNPQVTFKFKEAIVTYDFAAFTQTNNMFDTKSGGVSRSTAPEFTLERIVGDTPYLHRAVDQTWEYAGRISGLEYPYRLFDMTVDFVQAGQSIRSFEYGDCSVINYKVRTEYDKEEGFTSGGKVGFALIETYTFTCNGYNPQALTYDAMKASIDDKYTPYMEKN